MPDVDILFSVVLEQVEFGREVSEFTFRHHVDETESSELYSGTGGCHSHKVGVALRNLENLFRVGDVSNLLGSTQISVFIEASSRDAAGGNCFFGVTVACVRSDPLHLQ